MQGLLGRAVASVQTWLRNYILRTCAELEVFIDSLTKGIGLKPLVKAEGVTVMGRPLTSDGARQQALHMHAPYG